MACFYATPDFLYHIPEIFRHARAIILIAELVEAIWYENGGPKGMNVGDALELVFMADSDNSAESELILVK